MGRSHPSVNEGHRLLAFLNRMSSAKISEAADIIIVDGGSTDGSLELSMLRHQNVRGLLLKTGPVS